MKKRLVLFGAIGCLLITLYFLQGPIMVWGAKRFISSTFSSEKGQTLIYDNAQFEKGRLVLSGVRLNQGSNQLVLDRLELKVHFNFKKWALEPQISLDHPNLQLASEGNFAFAEWVNALKPSGFYYLKMDVQHGVLQIEDQRFYFSFESGKTRGSLGTLRLSLDPSLLSHPFLVARFEMREDELVAGLKMEHVQSDQVLKLLAMTGLEWAKHWQGAQGVIDLEGYAVLTANGRIRQSSAEFSFANLELSHLDQPLLFKAGNLGGSLHLNPEESLFWKGVSANISLENAHLELKEHFALADISGHLNFDQNEEPSIVLNGKLGKLPFSLDGKGALHQDQTYWLESVLQFGLGTKEQSQLFVSLCSPQADELVLALDAKQCRGSPLALLQSFWGGKVRLIDGSLDGKGLARFRKGALESLEIQQLKGQKWLLSWGEGKRLRLQDFILSGSHSKGELSLALDTAQKERITATVKSKKGKHEISGQFEGTDRTNIQFGFTSEALIPTSVTDINDGWVRSSHLGSAFYRPLLKRLEIDLDLDGTFDLFGTFDGKELELSVQCDGLIARTPYFALKTDQVGQRDPMLLKTKGRAKFHYYPENNQFDLDLPLRSASFYELSQGLLLEGIDADLHVDSSKGFVAKFQKGALSYDGRELLQNLSAQITGTSAQIFQLSDLQAKIGEIDVKASELIFDHGISSIKAEIKDVLTFSAKREDQLLRVQAKLGIGELDAKVSYDSQLRRAHIEELLIKGVKGKLQAEGDLVFDLPETNLPFCICAELGFNAKIGNREFATAKRAKVAFSPDLGLEISDLHLEALGQIISVEQLEVLLPQDKLIARGCRFSDLPFTGLFELKKEAFSLNLSDSEGELKVDGKWDIALVEKIEGSLRGLTCKLKSSGPDQLKGQLEVDTAIWAAHLPQNWQKLPEGKLSLNGEFFLAPNLRFVGTLKAREGALQAKIEAGPQAIEFNDLSLSDETGHFKAAKASLRYISDRRTWGYVIPQVQINEASFASLPGVSVPKAQLHDLYGMLGDVDTLAGRGTFTFKAKPKAFAEKFRLDAAIGSPTSGEIDCEIKAGKCRLTALRDVVTQEKHVQFVLPENTNAFFDFRGNLFLDLLVKKGEARKNKKPLAVSVRGTVDQPQVTTH